MLKIGIACYPTVGGSGIVATRLGLQLAHRGHHVHFIAYERPFELPRAHSGIWFHSVKITQYDLFKYPDYALALAVKMAQVAREKELDLFHVHYAIPHATSAWIARQLLEGKGPKLLTTLHGTDISLIGRDRSFYELVRHSMAMSDGLSAVSEYLRGQTLSIFQLNRTIEVIPNFALPAHKKSLRPSFFPRGKKILIHVSNFRPIKRVADVIEVFDRVQRKVPSLLALVGDGSTREEAEHLIERLNLQEGVVFLGTRHDVGQLLAHSDLFLLPSEQESFGLAALEALANGVPVIATRVGGLPEVISEGEEGFLFPVGDVDGMASKAIGLLQDPARHRKFSARARQRAMELFGADRVVPQYEAYYGRLLGL
jgi:L-malate glycosyltransferase